MHAYIHITYIPSCKLSSQRKVLKFVHSTSACATFLRNSHLEYV